MGATGGQNYDDLLVHYLWIMISLSQIHMVGMYKCMYVHNHVYKCKISSKSFSYAYAYLYIYAYNMMGF